MTNIVPPEKKVVVKAPLKPLFDELRNNQVFENTAPGIMDILNNITLSRQECLQLADAIKI